MPMVTKGTLLKVNGSECLALKDSWSQRYIEPQDADAFNSGYDMSVINEFCEVQDADGRARRINLHRTRFEVLSRPA